MIPSPFQPIANHLWQSTLFALAAGLLALVLRRYGPQARYVLSLAASAKFLVPFSILTMAGSWFGQYTNVAVSPPLSFAVQQVSEPLVWEPFLDATSGVAAAGESELSSTTDWTSTALWTIWGLGSLCIVFRWMRGWRQIRSALRAASPIGQKAKVQVLSSPEIFEPGIVGIFRPILLLPQGIESYLTPVQLEAILQHEIAHVRRRDNLTGLIHRAVEVLFWFHPLVWWIGARLIEGRERACDEAVLRSGIEPEAYGEGILKVCEIYLKSPLPFVTGVTGSNLKARIEQIVSRRVAPELTLVKKAVLVSAGLFALAVPVMIGFLNAPALQARPQPQPQQEPQAQTILPPPSPPAQQPKPPVTRVPERVWTSSAEAPTNLLTQLEAQRHDAFIERAQAGNIDIVFFGTTDTEMWLWREPGRGRSVWDQTFGSLKAASFGSQGTHFESLLWRMRNGELDGYRAKLVVLQSVGDIVGDQAIGNPAEFVAGYTPIIAEIRARQPQAKILLMAPFPRGFVQREAWREVAAAKALVYAKLADDRTVFYTNIGERFFLPDGTHNSEMWTRSMPPNAGIHEPGFKVWAEELQPWLDRFVR